MKHRKLAGMKTNLAILVACIALGASSGVLATCASAQTPSNAQAVPGNLPAGVQEAVTLTKNGFGEDAILLRIKKAGVPYDLTTDQTIYLKNQGVSENVISALQQAGPPSTLTPAISAAPVTPPPPPATTSGPPSAPAPAPTGSAGPPEPTGGPTTTAATPSTPAEPVLNANYVQEQLTPYGTWVDVPGYGRCWQPSELPDGWRPYYDSGHWVYTDAGLYWQSDYPWGAIPFHYGRWAWAGDDYRWIWIPGYEYAPAWVFWRHADADGYLGWAPLPYGAVWVVGGWWEYRGVRVAADYDFGFGPRFFVFVDHRHFWEHDYHPFVLRGGERDRIYRISVINRVRVDEHGRFVHEGLDREHLERFTGRKVDVVRHAELRNQEHEKLRVDRERVVERQRSREGERPGPGERPDKGGHPGAGERPDKGGHPGAGERPDKGEHPDKGGQPDKGGHPDKGDQKDPKQSKGNNNQRFGQVS
jgi:hypothetical protein